jgi:predicted TIM-barrel fold metal-dependent hydrolase
MPYATGRTFLDADSHIMERPDFIRDFADESTRAALPPIFGDNQGKTSNLRDEVVKQAGHTAERVREMVELGDTLISGPKGYLALGAFNKEERTQALDQLGFSQQLVFATYSAEQTLLHPDIDLRYGAAAAHNRAMADFCSADSRFIGVANLPMDDPSRSVKEVEQIKRLGLKVAWISHDHCGGRSPGHDELDPVWASLVDADIPFVLHVGGYPIQLSEPWMNTGRPIPLDWQGGGENIRGKDMIALHHYAELFLGAMIFDGVFERHPRLRGGAIELGAGWVPSWMRRLDWTASIWKKEDDLGRLTRQPSEIVQEHLAFTPYVYEDVGRLISESDDSLYMFSSDYPHFEGSRNPIERFEGFLGDASDGAKDKFYAGNFKRLFAA